MPDDAAEGDDDVDVPPPAEPGPSSSSGPGLLLRLSDEVAELRRRVEVVQQDVAGLVARLHALDGAITGVEVTLGDRLTEYSDTVVQLGRGLTSNVSTYREGNERSVSELRRALADSEELLRAVLTRADDLALGMEAVRAALTSETAHDSLAANDVRAIVDDAVARFDLRGDMETLATDIAALGERLSTELAASATAQPVSSAVDGAVYAELLASIETMRGEVERLRRSETRGARSKVAVEQEQALVAELQAIREELAQLKRRIAVRAKASVIDDEQIATIVEQVRAAVDVRLPPTEIERIAEAVARRMAETFEVVADDEPVVPAREPAPSRPSKPPSSRRR